MSITLNCMYQQICKIDKTIECVFVISFPYTITILGSYLYITIS